MSDVVLGFVELLQTVEKLKKLPQEWGNEALRRVQDYSPVATGLLKSSWQLKIEDGVLTLQNNAQDAQGVYYAPFQEFGTVHDAPQLFLTRTVEESPAIMKVAKQKVGL